MRKFFMMMGILAAVLSTASAPVVKNWNLCQIAWNNLEDVEIQATLTAFGFYGGHFYLKLEGDEEYYVLFPLALMRLANFEIELGDNLKVQGKKLLHEGKIIVVPKVIEYEGKRIDILQKMMKFMKIKDRFQRRRAPLKPMMKKPPMFPHTMQYVKPGF